LNLGVGGTEAIRSGGKTPMGGHRAGSAATGETLGSQNQVKELSVYLEGLEKECDFYFAKV